jgi:hypothetical protein
MSRKHKKQEPAKQPSPVVIPNEASLRHDYDRACKLAVDRRPKEARHLYEMLAGATGSVALKALIRNDLGTLAFLDGDFPAARQEFQSALELDRQCEPARTNLAFLEQEEREDGEREGEGERRDPAGRIRVAILSFLFNWPTTGGGNVHTYELAIFLEKAGYEVKHFYVRYSPLPWRVGQVPDPLPYPSQEGKRGRSESAGKKPARSSGCKCRTRKD